MFGKYNEYEFDMDYLGLTDEEWNSFSETLKKNVGETVTEDDRKVIYRTVNDKITLYHAKVIIFSILSDVLDDINDYEAFSANVKNEEKDDSSGQKRILPFCNKPEITTYLFYAERMGILQSYEKFRSHLKKSFLNVKIFYNSSSVNCYFFDEDIDSLLDNDYVTFERLKNVKDMIRYIRKSIDGKRYINISLDEYYIKAKELYGIKHYVHDSLIYGYDDMRKVFYCFGFVKGQKIKAFEASYKEILYGYEKGKLFFFCGADYLETYPWPVVSTGVKNIDISHFSEDDMITSAKSYLFPGPDETVENDLHIYGINVADYAACVLAGEQKEIVPVDYRTVHFLWEHKKCIYDRLKLLSIQNERKAFYTEIVKKYKKVLQEYQKVKLAYIDEIVKENGFFFGALSVKNRKFRRKTGNILKEATMLEREILTDLIQ